MSLSARRAWIEMDTPPHEHKANTVALRKESVDRNIPNKGTLRNTHKSLSARRAWIEITGTMGKSNSAISRSPQGERG